MSTHDSWELARWAYRVEDLRAVERAVLVALCWHANEDGDCRVRQAKLAALTCFSERAVWGALAALEKRSLIAREARPRKDSPRRLTDLITVFPPAAVASGTPDHPQDVRAVAPGPPAPVAKRTTTTSTERDRGSVLPAPPAGGHDDPETVRELIERSLASVA